MIKSKEQFLKDLTEDPKLKENIIAYVFGANPDLNISAKNAFFDTVKSYYERYRIEKPKLETISNEEDEEINNWQGLDLRIKNVKLKSVKGFPDSEVPFGIDFSNESDSTQSMVILGGNATGKSSIYDALEYVYCDEIGEAELRKFKEVNKNRFKFFLEHFENGIESTFCKIETVSKTFDIQNQPNIPNSVKKRINPSTHFISDFDVYQNGQLDYQNNVSRSFHNQIAKSLGLAELLDFDKHLKSFIAYRRVTESRSIKSSETNIKDQLKFIETNKKAISEKKIRLEQLQKNQKTNP